MLQALIAGLVLGGVYAIAASGLVVTYISTGVLNFAFGAMAFCVARFYYFLVMQHGWAIVPAALLSIVVVGPTLGVVLYLALFRFLRRSSAVIKVVATIGLSVALPALAIQLMGNEPISVVPGLAPRPVHVFQVADVAITLDQLIVYASVVAVVIIGTIVLRFTEIGLSVRAMVDSEALTSLSGVYPRRIFVGVWATSSFLAGLCGVLGAPIVGLTPDNFTLLVAGAFAAVLAARLRSLPVAVVAGLAMGIVGAVISDVVPSSSSFSSAVIPSVPFLFILLALIYFVARSGSVSETAGRGGALDAAIAVVSSSDSGAAVKRRPATARGARLRDAGTGVLPIALVVVLIFVLQGSWVGLLGAGLAFAVCFLSYTLITGEAGMIWLCQITFAGIGAITTAQLATNHGWPVLAAAVAGGVVTLLIGAVVGLLTIRLGDLYVALATLAFGLLIDNVVFTWPSFVAFGAGVTVNRPSFAVGDRQFDLLVLAIFALLAILVANIRRSTSGLAFNAVRRSAAGAASVGVGSVPMKVLAATLGAGIAGLGGGLLAMSSQFALPESFTTLGGLVWLAVLVTIGVRSNAAALIAGLTFSLLPGVFLSYLPLSVGQVPTILFGLGAVLVARNPDGVLAQNVRQAKAVVGRLGRRRTVGEQVESPTAESATHAVVTDRPTAPDRRLQVVGSPAPPPVLRAERVTVQFGGLVAVSDVSIEVPAGATIGLVGPNGAGKTTLFSVLSGLRKPAVGTVRLHGIDITRLSPQARARAGVGRTFQHTELFAGLTVREHLVLADRVSQSPRRLLTDVVTGAGFRRASRDEDSRIDSLVDQLGIQAIVDSQVDGLPLGSCRLVELGRCLAGRPSVLLLDEPFSGLDSHETERVAALLRAVGKTGVAMLLIEHDVELVMALCERVTVLDFGGVLASGTPAEVRSDPRVGAAYLGEQIVEEGRAS
jgi:branched-chain amino acid transport system permease protein